MPNRYDDPELIEDDDVPEDDNTAFVDTHAEEEEDPGIEEDDENELPDPGAAEDPEDSEPDEAISDDEGETEGEAILQAEISARAPRLVRVGDLLLDYKHWQNPRTFTGLDSDSLQSLANDIRQKSIPTGKEVMAGIDEPLLVVRILAKGGEVDQLVIDGQRRFRAVEMTDLGPDVLVPVRDREPEPVEWSEALAQQYLQDVLTVVGLRQGLSAFELSESAVRLRATIDPATGKPLVHAKIATVIGRSESWVSKILAARAAAAPKLLERWRKGELSEEQFRDLATSVADQEEQAQAAEETAKTRREDKAGARVSAKERREVALREARAKRDKEKADRLAAKAKAKEDRKAAREAKKEAKAGKGKKAPVVKGPQADLPLAADKPAQPARPKALSPAKIEDLLASSGKRPPTHDLAKGIILGIQVGTGRLDFADLPKQWHRYIEHLSGGSDKKSGAKKRR